MAKIPNRSHTKPIAIVRSKFNFQHRKLRVGIDFKPRFYVDFKHHKLAAECLNIMNSLLPFSKMRQQCGSGSRDQPPYQKSIENVQCKHDYGIFD